MAENAIDAGPAAGAGVLINTRNPWARRYVGIPFAETGFDRSGCHCWGLVCLVYADELAIALPRHDTIAAAELQAMVRVVRAARQMRPWIAVAGPRRDFDVVLMAATVPDGTGRLRRLESHVGIAVGERSILHVERGIDAVCVPERHPSIRHRILAAYRHEQLA